MDLNELLINNIITKLALDEGKNLDEPDTAIANTIICAIKMDHIRIKIFHISTTHILIKSRIKKSNRS